MNDDQEQFVLLLLRHRHQILAFIAKQLVNASDVEDVFQKTSLVLWKKMDDFDADHSFLNWAFGIAHNEIRNHIRTKSRDKLHFSPTLLDLLANESSEEAELSQARRQALTVCLSQLPESQQQLIRQCYLDSKPITKVAQEIGTNRGALYKKLARIKQKIALCIRSRITTQGGLV